MFLWTSILMSAWLSLVLSFNFLQCAITNDLHSFGCYQYNFVGRLLGPRGNSLKRVEASTQCRVYIRGCGSVKDSVKVTKHIIIYCSLVPYFNIIIWLKLLDTFRMYCVLLSYLLCGI